MTGIVRLAGARSIDGLAVIPIGPIPMTLARHAVWIAIISETATVAIFRGILLSALAFASGVRAISGRVEHVALACC